MSKISFDREHTFTYGVSETVAPGLRRVTANNPGPFTFHGTGTYVIGETEPAVIDPGPALDDHHHSLLRCVAEQSVKHVLVTHCHMDHAGLALDFAESVGQRVSGFIHDHAYSDGLGAESAIQSYRPQISLKDGDVVEGEDYRLQALHTPGHTSDHLCFVDEINRNLYCGDHIMAWSTTVILPPDGDMGEYLGSLERLLEFENYVFWPTHGPPIRRPAEWISQLIAHRENREQQLIRALELNPGSANQLVRGLYPDIDPRLIRAASQSIFAGLLFLLQREMVTTDTASPHHDSVFELN